MVKIGLILALSALCALSAAARSPTPKRPIGNKVMVVGRIVLKQDIARAFYAKSFGVSADAADTYMLPNKACTGSKRVNRGEAYVNVGDFFFMTYTLPKDRVFRFDGCLLQFFGKKELMIGVPLRLSCPVPEGVKYLYIGTYVIDVANNDFVIRDIQVRDEYDIAKEELLRLVGQRATLYRSPVSYDKDQRCKSSFFFPVYGTDGFWTSID